MSNSKISNKTFLSRVCKILGANSQASIVRFLSPFLRKQDFFNLPEDITLAKSAVILMPEPSKNTAELVKALLSIIQLLSSAKIMVICESSVETIYKSANSDLEIFTYEEQNCFLFSREMTALKSVLSNRECDICISLDQNPHIALVHLLSALSPKIRIGFDNPESGFFFNMRFREKSVSENHSVLPCIQMAAFLGCTFPVGVNTEVSLTGAEA